MMGEPTGGIQATSSLEAFVPLEEVTKRMGCASESLSGQRGGVGGQDSPKVGH